MEGRISHSSQVLRRCHSEQSSCCCEFGSRSFINIRLKQLVTKKKQLYFFISQSISPSDSVLRQENTSWSVQYVIKLPTFIYLLEIMRIPAYTSPTLFLGRTFDRDTLSACADISSSNDKPVKKMDINKFSFKYQVVTSSQDVNDLLDISGELSLQIKANLLKMEGAGQYVKESKVQEGRTNLLAVMKCTTVTYVFSLKTRCRHLKIFSYTKAFKDCNEKILITKPTLPLVKWLIISWLTVAALVLLWYSRLNICY